MGLGLGHSCAVVNGAAKCWGQNSLGQLGNNSNEVSLIPAQVDGLTSGVTAISAGVQHSCAIVNGSAKCWGRNMEGQLGNNSNSNSLVPVVVEGLDSGVSSITSGYQHTCAVHHTKLKCWGVAHSPLGLNEARAFNTKIPQTVPYLTGTATQVSAGGYGIDGSGHSCAVVDNRVYCWGKNTQGTVGDRLDVIENTTHVFVPILKPIF